MFARLRPTHAQMQRLALRETDPRESPSFEPIERGPIVGFLVLAWVGLAAIVAIPCIATVRAFRAER